MRHLSRVASPATVWLLPQAAVPPGRYQAASHETHPFMRGRRLLASLRDGESVPSPDELSEPCLRPLEKAVLIKDLKTSRRINGLR
jgi:hypothetical protein